MHIFFFFVSIQHVCLFWHVKKIWNKIFSKCNVCRYTWFELFFVCFRSPNQLPCLWHNRARAGSQSPPSSSTSWQHYPHLRTHCHGCLGPISWQHCSCYASPRALCLSCPGFSTPHSGLRSLPDGANFDNKMKCATIKLTDNELTVNQAKHKILICKK